MLYSPVSTDATFPALFCSQLSEALMKNFDKNCILAADEKVSPRDRENASTRRGKGDRPLRKE